MAKRILITAGEVLKEEFLKPMGISNYALAKAIGVSPTLVGNIVKGRQGITPDIAYRLSLFFGTTAQMWLNLQNLCDLDALEEKYKGAKSEIPNYKTLVPNYA